MIQPSVEMFYCFSFFLFNFFNIKWLGKKYFHSYGLNSEKNLVLFSTRVNSIIHSFNIFFISNNIITGKITSEEFLEKINITRAYLLYDMLIMIYYYEFHLPNFFIMMVHHSLFFCGLFFDTVNQYPVLLAHGLTAEITNPFLYLGWYLIKMKKTNIFVFKLDSIILVLLFFLYRVINFIQLFLIGIAEKKWVETFIFFIIMDMNLLWFIKLIYKCIREIIS